MISESKYLINQKQNQLQNKNQNSSSCNPDSFSKLNKNDVKKKLINTFRDNKSEDKNIFNNEHDKINKPYPTRNLNNTNSISKMNAKDKSTTLDKSFDRSESEINLSKVLYENPNQNIFKTKEMNRD